MVAWNPFEIRSWASALGMADVPLFGKNYGKDVLGNHAVMLDGSAASFSISSGDDLGTLLGLDPLLWAWSSNLRHAVVLSDRTGEMFLRRWDSPHQDFRVRVPRTSSEVEGLLAKILKSTRPRGGDVVGQMIVAFKSLRAVLSAHDAANVDVILAFNLLVLALEQDKTGRALSGCSRLGDLFTVVESIQEIDDRLRPFRDAYIEEAIAVILNAAPGGFPLLDPHLLMRHAAGQFFQEAHFELERQPIVQRTLWGPEPNRTSRGRQQRDARFTPTSLARSLVEQGLEHDPILHQGGLVVLDPACGSGVFLQEVLRELERSEYQGRVHLIGFDASPIATAIAKFCLDRAVKELSPAILAAVTIEQRDALRTDCEWGRPSLILMNPPFASYKDMDEESKRRSGETLGALAVGQFDKAMAFLWKAVQSLGPGGVLASVLPSTLLDSQNGLKWRSALLDASELCTVGRFRGYGYFPGAMVEPAVVVLKKLDKTEDVLKPLTVFIAEEGSEDAVLRALRKGTAWTESQGNGFYLSLNHDRSIVDAGAWMPRTFRNEDLFKAMPADTPTVGDLFEVNQGALTGMNEAFIVDGEGFFTLPLSEQRYFRPCAGTNTIRNGALRRKEWVFYPYDESGLLLQSEADLLSEVEAFYHWHLVQHKERLSKRRGKEDQWWTLTEPRAWQYARAPKLVTAYFGTSGHFAFDSDGAFISLHGYAWNRSDSVSIAIDSDDGDADAASASFYETDLPWAYIAILNSAPFRVLLSCFCTRVQGGQFNLSKRFVRSIPLPDLMGGTIPGDIVDSLIDVGRSQHEPKNDGALSALVARAYGVPMAAWGLEKTV